MVIQQTETRPKGIIRLDDEEAVKDLLVGTVFGLWDIISELTRLRPSYRERYRVTIFGSARAEVGTFPYEEVKRVAGALSAMGCDIITGGGPGLMQAANEGAGAKSAEDGEAQHSVGIRVELPFEQEKNPFVTELFQHKTFFSRLHHFVLTSDAFVVAPGGIGTLLEFSMVWQLLQVKDLKGVPLILVGKMWPPLIDWAKQHLLNNVLPLVNAEDLDIPECVADGDQAIEVLRRHHALWQAEQQKSS